MIFAMLCTALLMTTIVVFGLITENARDLPERSSRDDMQSKDDGRELERNQDRARDKEAQKKIAKANAPKKNAQKNPIQQMAPIPLPKKEKGSIKNKAPISSKGVTRNVSKGVTSVVSKKR